MKYMGSKSRIAKDIVPIIQHYIDTNNITTYWEPFCGGANIIDKIHCAYRIGTDKNQYLIALLKHVQDGLPLLEAVSRNLYSEVRSKYQSGIYEDWYVGNIGFLASYNGRWFDGGYAQPGYEKTKNGQRYRDYYNEAKNNILTQAPNLQNIDFICADYLTYSPPHNFLIYCDPPYTNTKQYLNSATFDYDLFWNTMRTWSSDNIVLISEESAPSDFQCVWDKPVSRSIQSTDKSISTEKLFIYNTK